GDRIAALLRWKDTLVRRTHEERRRSLVEIRAALGAQTIELPAHSQLLDARDLDQMARASDVWHVGSHTVHHVSLSSEAPLDAERELRESRHALEAALQREVVTLAYPHGAFSDETLRLLPKVGYRAAATVRVGCNRAGTDPFQM